MKNNILSYKDSVLIKELGFDRVVNKFYTKDSKSKPLEGAYYDWNSKETSVSAPSPAIVFLWLIDKAGRDRKITNLLFRLVTYLPKVKNTYELIQGSNLITSNGFIEVKYVTKTLSERIIDSNNHAFSLFKAKPIPLNNFFLKELGFKKIAVSMELEYAPHCFISLSENDFHEQERTWYVFIRNRVSRGEDDLVSLRMDIRYVHEIQLILASLGCKPKSLKNVSTNNT